jgi:glycosyltransferase involved in cell wall biosynthesis
VSSQPLAELSAPPAQGGAGRRLLYLSGAPRVSTRPEAETTGARSHILGMSGAFERLGWRVDRFIVGDRVPRSWRATGSHRAASKTYARRVAADVVRIVLGRVNARRARAMCRGGVDLIYERFGAFQALGAACRGDGALWVLESNGPLFYEAKVERKSLALGALARLLERRAYRACDLLVCVSDSLKEILVASCDVPPEKVVVIPNGVDTTFYDPARYEPTRIHQGFTVGFVGNLYAWAGLGPLLQAVAELRDSGMDISAVLVGDGMVRGRCEDEARRLGIADRVTFVGRVARETVPRYIAGFDVGYSGQVTLQMGAMYHSPLKIYEYMAMGRPAVASGFADARRAIRDDVTGFLFEPGDAESLKGALRRAYDARDRLEQMGARARAEAVAHHSWTARARTLLAEVGARQAARRHSRAAAATYPAEVEAT